MALEKEIFRGLEVKDDSRDPDENETETGLVEKLEDEEREATD